MNRTSNLNKNAKAKLLTTKSYDCPQGETATDSFGHSAVQVHNRPININATTTDSDRHDTIQNDGSSNSTMLETIPKTQKEKHAHSYRTRESDYAYPKSYEDSKHKHHFSYSKSYNEDGRGNSNQPPAKLPLEGNQSYSKSYLQGKKGDSVNSDSAIETTTQGKPKGKLFTQPFVPQSHHQNGQQRHYTSSGGRQQQQQHQTYYSSGAKYQPTSPILTVEQSPVSIHMHPHSISYTSTPHHAHYSYNQTTNPASPQPIHPQLSPSLPAPSAPIPIPHSWTTPGIPHYYAVPSPMYDYQQMQYHQYPSPYHHHSPHTTPAYTYYPNQSFPAPAPQTNQHQQPHPSTSPLIQKSPSMQTHPSQHSPSSKSLPRTSKAIPIINPNTMTPVQADIHPGHSISSGSNNDKKFNDDKKNGKPAPMTASAQFIDPAIKEQEEREQQEREEEEHEREREINQQQQQADKEKVDGLVTATMDDEASKAGVDTAKATDLQKVVEITCIRSTTSPETTDLEPQQSETAHPSSAKSADNSNLVSPTVPSPAENENETDDVIQYDPAFLMQFMPLCLDTTEDLSSFQNTLDLGEHGRSDKRQHYGNGDRNNAFRSGGNGTNGNKNYSRSAPGPGGISILANQMTTTHYIGRDGRSEMGKFIGGRTLTGRTNCNNSATPTSSNINNLINATINSTTAFSGDSSKMQRDGSFGGRTKHATQPGRPSSNGINKRYPHHDHYHHHHQHSGAPTIPFDQVTPLEKSANRWVPSIATSSTTTAEKDNDNGTLTQEEITRKIKALLNKLTLERFDTISDRIIGYAEQSTKEDDGQSLRTVIQLIFEKACDEAAFASMWAQLCRKLYEWIPADIKDVHTKDKNGEPVCGIPLYCKYLFSRCQYEFEKGWKSLPTAGMPTSGGDDNDRDRSHNISGTVDGDGDNGDLNKKKHVATTSGEAMLTDEYYTAMKIKRRGLGLVQFIGELYCRDMLSQRIMSQCLSRLCNNGADAQEEEVESLCKLLTTIGADIDRDPQAAAGFEFFFKRMQNEMYNSPHLSSRVKFMIMDVVDLRSNNWVPRNGKQDKPKTIAEIHEDAERAKILEKEAFAKRSGSSRGGASLLSSSNPNGGNRQNYRTNGKSMKKSNGSGIAATSNDNSGWNAVNGATNSLSRHNDVTDYSNFGRTERARPRNNNLVPSYSPFASLNRSGSNNGDDSGAQKSALRRKSSSTSHDGLVSNKSAGSASNMFSALGDNHKETEQRKKMMVLPRGSVLPSQHSSSTEQTQATSTSASNAQLKRRIKNTLAEYYELADLEELFTSIKEVLDQPEAQPLLAMELLGVVEMKEKQVIAVGEVIPQLFKANLLDKDVLVKTVQEFMRGYEDLVIDIPQAPIYIARLLVQAGIGLSVACVYIPLPNGLEKAYIAMSSP